MNVFTVWNFAVLALALGFWFIGLLHSNHAAIAFGWGAYLAVILFALLAAVGQLIGAPIG